VSDTEPGAIEVVRHGQSYDDAEVFALELAGSLQDQGGRFVSAYNDPDVIAGQGTIALELLEQVPDTETIVAPVGGGGLLAGLCLALATSRGTRVCGVEPEASAAVSEAVAAGRIVEIREQPTIADGLAGNLEAGSVTVPIISRHVSRLVRIGEGPIRDAVRFLALEHGLVVEPSGAAAVGAVMGGLVEPSGGSTVVVVTGRNVSPALVVELLGPFGGDSRR